MTVGHPLNDFTHSRFGRRSLLPLVAVSSLRQSSETPSTVLPYASDEIPFPIADDLRRRWFDDIRAA